MTASRPRPAQITINGTSIFNGTSWFASWDGQGQGQNAPWTTVAITIPTSYFTVGANSKYKSVGDIVADAAVTRGGCLVESDIGIIDASIESRWRRAAAALGSQADWAGTAPAAEEPQS